MKLKAFVLFLFITFPVFAQRISTVGILPFEVSGDGVSPADATEAARQVAAEFRSWGALTVLTGVEADGAEYLVRGQISRHNNRIVLDATTSLRGSGRVLNTSKEEAASLNAISFVSFCAQIAENIPFPNYLLGKWRSSIDMPDGPITCIMEFRPDLTIQVEQYDTWEHSGTDSLKYQGIGAGNYTYTGYYRRTVNVGGRQVTTDATVGIVLTLEDALSIYTTIDVGGVRVLYNDSKSSFDFVSGALPCGENHSGPSIYPSENVFYASFVKIQ